MNYNIPMNPNPGWSCPKCSRIHAPWVALCFYCSPQYNTVPRTVVQPSMNVIPLTINCAVGGPVGAGIANNAWPVGINDMKINYAGSTIASAAYKEDGWRG